MDASKTTKKEFCYLLVTFYAETEKLDKKKKMNLLHSWGRGWKQVKVTRLMGHQEQSIKKMVL